jgi:hypothetical protein
MKSNVLLNLASASSTKQENLDSLLRVTSWCLPQISAINTKPTTYKISITPVWVNESSSNLKIQYPSSLTMEDNDGRYLFDTLAKYRSVQNNKNVIDFITHPFIPNVESNETLIAILSMFARSQGMQLSFADTPFSYEDSAYRCALGVTDLASLFWINGNGSSMIPTAKFTFILDIDFGKVTANKETIKDFVFSFIKDIGATLDCPLEYVRVFELTKCCTQVTFGLTTPDSQQTQNLATRLRYTANRPSNGTMRSVLHHLRPLDYPFEMTSVLTHLQLQPSDFQPIHNRNYANWPANDSVQQRGNRPYYLPVGWYRHALRVIDKYGNQETRWLGMTNGPNEWTVAYHGTKWYAVRSIVDTVLGPGRADFYRCEAVQIIGARADTDGIYLATHCNGGSDNDRYAEHFTVNLPTGNAGTTECYRIVFQCRVQPDAFTEHNWAIGTPASPLIREIRVFERDAIRPYGILLRKITLERG